MSYYSRWHIPLICVFGGISYLVYSNRTKAKHSTQAVHSDESFIVKPHHHYLPYENMRISHTLYGMPLLHSYEWTALYMNDGPQKSYILREKGVQPPMYLTKDGSTLKLSSTPHTSWIIEGDTIYTNHTEKNYITCNGEDCILVMDENKEGIKDHKWNIHLSDPTLVDVSSDGPVEVGSDGQVEVGSDGTVDADSDSPVDADSDGPVDADSDSPVDTDSEDEI